MDSASCIHCGLCFDICPGKGIELMSLGKDLFGANSGIKTDLCSGLFLNTYVGHSTNEEIRYHSATGGMVTQFLIWLLKKGEINGAVVVRYRKDCPMEPEPFIALTEEEIWDSRSNKYVVLSMDKVARQIADGKYKKLAVVGLPCQIQAWRQLSKRNKKVRESICVFFAIYCSVNKTKHSLDYYPIRYKVDSDSIGRFAFRDEGCMGYMKFEDKKGNTVKKVPYLSFWFGTHSFFSNHRCSVCIDQLGEVADISFGDIHIKPYSEDRIGTNSIITRSKKWDDLLKLCRDEGFITLDEISIDTLTSSQIYAKTFKKGAGVKTNMQLRRIIGKVNPTYDYTYTGNLTCKDIICEICKAIMRSIGKRRKLWWIIIMLDKKQD